MSERFNGFYETEAITLRTYKLGDADKIAVLLTKQRGLVRGVAKGARRLKSRYGACLEIGTHIAISFREKEGQELVKLGQTDILRSYFELSREPKHVAIFEHICDLIIHFAPPHEPDERLFRMTKACLEAAASSASSSVASVVSVTSAVSAAASNEGASQAMSLIARYFEVWTLRLGGFLANLRCCARCGRELKACGANGSDDGRLYCTQCGAGVSLSANAVERLQSTQHLSPLEWLQNARTMNPEIEAELAHFTRRAIMHTLERATR